MKIIILFCHQTKILESESKNDTEVMTEDIIYQKVLNEVQRHLADMGQITDIAKILYIKDITKKYISRF